MSPPRDSTFLFHYYAHHRDLHSFPTRRSSDLRAFSWPIASGKWPRRFGNFRMSTASRLSWTPHRPRYTVGCRRFSRPTIRSEEHTSELQSHSDLVCRLLLEKKKTKYSV